MPLMIIGLILAVFLAIIFTFLLVYFSTKGIIHVARSLQQPSLPRPIAASLRESRRFGRMIMATAQQYPAGPMRDRLNRTIQPVNDWLLNLNRLEQALGKLYGQRNLARELRQTNFEIEELRRQFQGATGQEISYLRDLMESKKHHLAALKELQLFQVQAELKVRKICSDLGATHAEMLLISARGDFNENRFQRLDENLQEHLTGLKDMLGAMEEMGYSRAVS